MDNLPYDRAANVMTLVNGRREIMNDPNRSILNKIDDLTEVHHGLYDPIVSAPGDGTLGKLMRIGMGAALGVGIVRGLGAVLDLGTTFKNNLETAAMGFGALMKSANDVEARRAFRIAFVKKAYEQGEFKAAGSYIGLSPLIVSPDALMAVPRGISKTMLMGSQAVGAGLGAIDSPSNGDVDAAELEVTRDMMRQRLSDAKGMRASQLLRQVLAKRKH